MEPQTEEPFERIRSEDEDERIRSEDEDEGIAEQLYRDIQSFYSQEFCSVMRGWWGNHQLVEYLQGDVDEPPEGFEDWLDCLVDDYKRAVKMFMCYWWSDDKFPFHDQLKKHSEGFYFGDF